MSDNPAGCCAPERPATGGPSRATSPPSGRRAPPGDDHGIEQCEIPVGAFSMGDHHHDGSPLDGERPVHEVNVQAFTIDATTVTNADFAAFVDATGYRTQAEVFGSSAVFHLVVAANDDDDIVSRGPRTPWWLLVRGADWRHPDGPASGISDRMDHPVVQVSWHDAQAYCDWAGRALPTEAQWERASRGGRAGLRFPWGNRPRASDGTWRLNIWQGSFPSRNTMADGWLTTAPVRSFEPNDFGLWQTVGNVWEWCAEVFDPKAYARAGTDRPGPPPHPNSPRVLRGGSYLCHDSYCNRYRNPARFGNTPDSSAGNTGFRTVAR